jgi:hypothetical protein
MHSARCDNIQIKVKRGRDRLDREVQLKPTVNELAKYFRLADAVKIKKWSGIEGVI